MGKEVGSGIITFIGHCVAFKYGWELHLEWGIYLVRMTNGSLLIDVF